MMLVAKTFCSERDLDSWIRWLDTEARRNLDPMPEGRTFLDGSNPLEAYLFDSGNRQTFTVIDVTDCQKQVGGFILRPGGSDAGPGVAYIEAVIVAPELRKTGIGAKMVGLVKETARGLGYSGLCASVFVDNPAAIRWLELAGLREGRWFAGAI